MTKLAILGILILIIGIGVSSGQRPPTISFREGGGQRYLRNNDQESGSPESQSSEVSKRVLDLSQKLLAKILDRSSNKFEVLSPVSISAALHLAFLGANGATFDEIKQFLGYDLSDNGSFKYHQEFSELLDELSQDQPSPSRQQLPWKSELANHLPFNMGKFKNGEIFHEIFVANGIFVQKDFSIRPDYKTAVLSVYKSDIMNLDFKRNPTGAAKYINSWVNEKTRGKITELIKGAVHSDTRVILANALYFKSLWLLPFSVGQCCVRDFFPDGVDGHSMKIKLMPNGGTFPYYKDAECDVAVMGFPYQKGISTMYVFLPNQSSKSKLREVQQCLTADRIQNILFKMQEVTAVVLFPRMHMSSSFNLRTLLKEMGLESIFDASRSDFSLMSDGSSSERPAESTRSRQSNPNDYRIHFPRRFIDASAPLKNLDKLRNENQGLPNPGLFADDVIHKVDLIINEKGTEGGAGTAISMQRTTQVVFRVDSPFLILIQHDPTRLPLFYGTVFEPVDDSPN